jgi:hypothetical protein
MMNTATVQRFKSSGKFYDEEVWQTDCETCAQFFDRIKWEANSSANQSDFIYLVTGEGTIPNLHPKLFFKVV